MCCDFCIKNNRFLKARKNNLQRREHFCKKLVPKWVRFKMMFTGSPARKRTSQTSSTSRGRQGASQNDRSGGESTRTRHNYEVRQFTKLIHLNYLLNREHFKHPMSHATFSFPFANQAVPYQNHPKLCLYNLLCFCLSFSGCDVMWMT